MRTQMHQDAFPGEDISDIPPPETSVPGLLRLIEGKDGMLPLEADASSGLFPSGRYLARELTPVQSAVR